MNFSQVVIVSDFQAVQAIMIPMIKKKVNIKAIKSDGIWVLVYISLHATLN